VAGQGPRSSLKQLALVCHLSRSHPQPAPQLITLQVGGPGGSDAMPW